MDGAQGRVACLLNAGEDPLALSFPLAGAHRLHDLWSGEDLGRREAGEVSVTLPARTGRVLVCTREA